MIRGCNLSGQPIWMSGGSGQSVWYGEVPWAHSIGQPVPYRYNFNPAIPFHTATIKPRPDLGWPVWIALLSSWVARVVRRIPLNGLCIPSPPYYDKEDHLLLPQQGLLYHQ